MCNRYRPARAEVIEAQWQLKPGPIWKAGIGPWGQGPFIRVVADDEPQLVVGQWALIGDADKKAINRPRMTNNARIETVAQLRTFKGPWTRGQRCVIPAESYDEPYYAEIDGKSFWWPFRRADGHPWHLAGMWNVWTDPSSGEVVESYTMLTTNCDAHPFLARFHKHEDSLPANQQDKRTVVPIETADLRTWLTGPIDKASALIRPPLLEVFDATTTWLVPAGVLLAAS